MSVIQLTYLEDSEMKAKKQMSFLMTIVVIVLLFTSPCNAQKGQINNLLEQGFANPTSVSRPFTWWHWMAGAVTKDGIIKDLQEMKKVGISGVQQFDVSVGMPIGPVKYLSDEWVELTKTAVDEANRLGLDYCIHNCAGWSSSGGPWITPELSMKQVVWSETQVPGSKIIHQKLGMPFSRNGFYKDITVLAFPSPKGTNIKMKDYDPRITYGENNVEVSQLMDEDIESSIELDIPTTGKPPVYLQVTFDQPFRARGMTILTSRRLGGSGEIQVSDDGSLFRVIRTFNFFNDWSLLPQISFPFNETEARYYRIVFDKLYGRDGTGLSEIELQQDYRLEDWSAKADFSRGFLPGMNFEKKLPKSFCIPKENIMDISDHVDEDGNLNWKAPEGHWTILRFGYTTTGSTNHPAAEEGLGLECDKMDKEAVQVHFKHVVGKFLEEVKPLATNIKLSTLIDSWEVWSQNWTLKMMDEFKNRKGYDLKMWLPVLTGRVVNSLEESERFLWDWRNVIDNLFQENYFGYFSELAHQNGIDLYIEPYGSGPFDNMGAGSKADVPMGEFWVGSKNTFRTKQAASIGHIYGQNIIANESFTANFEQSRWDNYPYALKALGDIHFCEGMNKIIFHEYVHQPNLTVKPGMNLFRWGTHFGWTNTWWDESTAWIDYLSRCQYLLQQGKFNADFCYFYGESSPNGIRPDIINPSLPEGYDYDICNADAIKTRMEVKDGKIVLPDGMNYRFLVLPHDDRYMTLELLRKIQKLVSAGAVVIGPKPLASPSLKDFTDTVEVHQVINEVWGNCDGVTVLEHHYGKGKVYWGKLFKDILYEERMIPDFQCVSTSVGGNSEINYIHRSVGDTDIYFIANAQPESEILKCSFRMSNKIPELWYPDNGKIKKATVYQIKNGWVELPLKLDPSGSVFVVFRPLKEEEHLVNVFYNGESGWDMESSFVKGFPIVDFLEKENDQLEVNVWRNGKYELYSNKGRRIDLLVTKLPDPVVVGGPWLVHFPSGWGTPQHITFKNLDSWSLHENTGVKYFSGTATYLKDFEIPGGMIRGERKYYLDLGQVDIIARVKVNGKDLGILWKPPFRVEMTDILKNGKNKLEIEVTNLWTNRLIGDEQFPSLYQYDGYKGIAGIGPIKNYPEWYLQNNPGPTTERNTFTTFKHYTKDDSLIDSGLLGPVTIYSVEMRNYAWKTGE